MVNCPDWIADTIAASRILAFSEDDCTPKQKIQFVEAALKTKPATQAVLTQYKVGTPLAKLTCQQLSRVTRSDMVFLRFYTRRRI
jgi:hypothetical protein